MKIIQLTQGKQALVDERDYNLVSRYKWHAHKSGRTFYAETNIKDQGGKFRTLKMHRLIAGAGFRELVDHRNCNGLDNRRGNLRIADCLKNSANRRSSRNSTGFKGVSPFRNKFRAGIRVNGRRIHLGYFRNPEDAAIAYSNAARLYFREFANVSLVAA